MLHALVVVSIAGMWSVAGNAATFELARRADGIIVQGVKVEGNIVPGDAEKLLDFYKTYGVMTSPLHLRSKGGNVEEAMKLGAIIRRLRLETEVPVWDTGRQPIDLIKVDNQENAICASACVLVYAAGASRFGNYLAMHRPYLPREEARNLSDVEYEAAEKEITAKTKAYLANMDIDQYWIDRIFSANSQEYYMPPWGEADSNLYHLMGVVPSLEEIILSKCNEDPDVDRKLKAFRPTGKSLSADELAQVKQIMQKFDVFFQCKKMVLSDMQRTAFERENHALIDNKCKQFHELTLSETETLKELFKKTNITPDEDRVRAQLSSEYDAYRQCRSSEIYALSFAAVNRWSEEFKKSERATHPAAAVDFDANGLSAEAMAKKGKEAYDAENYNAAMQWFRKAADLGNADAMMGMSWIYGNGRGVPEDDAEAMRWRKMSADHGNAVAMWLIGTEYEDGKLVPQNYVEAMRWYKKAADLDNADAMGRIGNLFSNGRGVPQDDTEGFRWYRKAADLGSPTAMWWIGTRYELGKGVPKDEAQARVWMKRAAALGDTGANMWLIDHP